MPHKDPEARRVYMRQYKAAHHERIREQNRLSYERHASDILQRRKERRSENLDASRAAFREYARAYRSRHADQIAAKQRQWRKDHPDEAHARTAAYYARNREAIRIRNLGRRCAAQGLTVEQWIAMQADRKAEAERRRAMRRTRLTPEERQERRRASARRYRLAHPERAKMAAKRWHEAHPTYRREWAERNEARDRAYYRAWHQANRERRHQRIRARYQENPLPFRAYAMAYHARKRGAAQGPIDHEAIARRDKGICQICKRPILNRRERSFDHIIPLSLGGPHTQGNLQLTHFRCNARRGAGRLPAQVRFDV